MSRGAVSGSLRALCLAHTALSPEDIALLEEVAASLQHMADLTGCDVFIDCMARDRSTALVVAEAKPSSDLSAYDRTVLGQEALPENEPAVYQALETGVVIRDLKAITQEQVAVRQNVVPIKNSVGTVIGVLIRESDISTAMRREQKYAALSRAREEWPAAPAPDPMSHPPYADGLQLREVHHRIKNSLQLVASMLNIQARKQENRQVTQVFQDYVGKVLSIAAIYDMLTLSGDQCVSLKRLLERICETIQQIGGSDYPVTILVEGDELSVPSDKASSIAMVVHELVFNALEHGYEPGQAGKIVVSLHRGSRYSSVMVEDNGRGFDPASVRKGSSGFGLISMMVRDKLRGELRFSTGLTGTKAFFDFR